MLQLLTTKRLSTKLCIQCTKLFTHRVLSVFWLSQPLQTADVKCLCVTATQGTGGDPVLPLAEALREHGAPPPTQRSNEAQPLATTPKTLTGLHIRHAATSGNQSSNHFSLCSSVHSCVRPYVRLSVHQSNHSSIHTFIQPSIQTTIHASI